MMPLHNPIFRNLFWIIPPGVLSKRDNPIFRDKKGKSTNGFFKGGRNWSFIYGFLLRCFRFLQNLFALQPLLWNCLINSTLLIVDWLNFFCGGSSTNQRQNVKENRVVCTQNSIKFRVGVDKLSVQVCNF